MTQTDFKNQVDNLMNILFGAGVASHATIIEQINYLVFLRSLSRKDDNAMKLDASAEMIFSGELKKYHWNNLLIFNADELFTSLEEVLKKLPEITTNQTIKLLFRDAHVKIYEKPTLRRLVHEIEKMFSDLEKQSSLGHTDVFGDMYEYLLSKLSQAGTLGSFRTPRHIIKFIVDVIDPKKGETILDPACGTAGFLVAALKHLEKKYTSEDFKKLDRYPMDLLSPDEQKYLRSHTFTGFDSDAEMFKFGLMNLYLHHLEDPKIKRQNTLVDTAGDRTKWDVILANPPFAGALDIDSVSEDLRMGTRSTEILFLRYIIDHLSSSGRAGVIVPEGVVFNLTNAHKKIRQMLVEDAGLWCVVSLPGGIFNPYAGVKTSILFFDKSLKNKVKDILFVKIENDGFDLGANKKPIDKNDLPEAINILNKYKLGEKPESKLALFVEKSKIVKYGDYNLSSDRYQALITTPHTTLSLVELNEICEKLTDGSHNPPKGVERGHPMISSKNVNNNEIDFTDVRYLSDEDFTSENKRTDIKPGNVLLTIVGTIGRSAVVPDNCFPFTAQRSVAVLKPSKTILPSFLNYILQSDHIQTTLNREATGVAQKGIYLNQLKKIKIPFPSLEIQKQIVEELDGYQKIINGAKQIVENWKPTIYVEKKWKNIKLSEIAEMIKRGKTPSYGDSKIQVIKSGQARGYFDFDFKNKHYVTKDFKLDERKLQHGDLLLNSTGVGTAGRITVFNFDGDFVADGHITIIRLDKTKANSLYVLFALTSVYGFKKIENMAQGNGGQIELSRETINNLTIPMPPIEKQKKIVDLIEIEKASIAPLYNLIETYKNKINKRVEEVWND